MKYSVNDAGHQADFNRRTKNYLAESRPRTHLPMRVPGLRYRNSLRQIGLRAPLPEIYAETKLDASDPLPFRLNSFSTHSTKNS
jgi:hypothetical protein